MIDRRAFALGLVGLASACSGSPGFGQLASGETGSVVQVRSGEVLFLDNGLEVRLAGIEGPNGDEPLAAEAKSALTVLALGKTATLGYGGLKRDRYERALAHVKARGKWLQGELLSAGLARVRTYSDNRALAAEMLELEARARMAKAGLWALPEYGVLLPGECRGKGGFQIVEGRVAAVSQNQGGAHLRLVGGAGVDIPAFTLDMFEAAGLAPGSLSGRLIRARGSLRSNALRVDHPEQIEVLIDAETEARAVEALRRR